MSIVSFMRLGMLFLWFSVGLYAAKVNHIQWEKGLDFEGYLKRHNIVASIAESLDKEDAQLLSEIDQNGRYYEMVASNGVLLQTLIPTGEELQIHLFRTPKGYKLEIIPIAYKKDTYITQLSVESTPYSDILEYVKNKLLATEFTKVLKHSVNFRGIRRGDKLAIVYDQKMRLGQPIGTPDIKVALMETKGRRNYVFKHTDQKYYDENGEELIKKYLGKPLKHIRITSPFTHRRFHPVLKRWKAHLGTDFGARRGTPIMAAADGKVIFSGWKGGYGKVIEIKHADGYKTLYAHQSRLKAKVGQWVKKGEVIGYVGSTGRSTGPHLHFGLYKNGRAINPMKLIKFSSKGLWGEEKKAFLRRKDKYTKIIDKIFDDNYPSYIWNTVESSSVSPHMRDYYKYLGW